MTIDGATLYTHVAMVEKDRNLEGREGQDEPSKEDGTDRSNGSAQSGKDGPSDTNATGGAAWGSGIHRFSEAWTRFEIRLCAGVVVSEILALCAWVLLKGLAVPSGSDSAAGVIVRAAVGATTLGLVTYFIVRKKNPSLVRFSVSGAILIGLLIAKGWDGVGSVYFSNLLNWLQDSSSLTLIGGLRGLGTRLTVWLAMLGGSLAAASGKHIHIDVVRRFLPQKLRMPATGLAWVCAASVCFTAAWGFTDHIAVGTYQVDRNQPASVKLKAVVHHAGLGFFVLRKQLRFDLSTVTVVLSANPYDSWLTNGEWNERITDAGWEDHFTPEEVKALHMPPESAADKRMPMVVVPGMTDSGMLKHLLNMIFPVGFIFIGLRFLLRAILLISGHVKDEQEEIAPTMEKGAEG